MMFLTKTSMLLLLALCCLSSALGAKIAKPKVEKPTKNDIADKAEAAAAAAAAAEVEQAVDEDDDDDDDEEASASADDKEDDDDDKDDDDDADAEEEAEADKEATATGDKNAVQPANPTDLSVWGMVRTLWGWLRSDLGESLFGDDDDKPTSAVEGRQGRQARTFGKIRRLQMALIPIIFKFGVLSAMVAFLVVIGMKSLFLLKVLVAMNAVAILGKFITLKSGLFGQYEHSTPSFNYNGWNPHAKESWGTTGTGPSQQQPHPGKEIHLHIHGNANAQAQLAGNSGYAYDSQNQGWASRSDPYVAYAPSGSSQYAEPQSEVASHSDAMSLLPTKYPARQLRR